MNSFKKLVLNWKLDYAQELLFSGGMLEDGYNEKIWTIWLKESFDIFIKWVWGWQARDLDITWPNKWELGLKVPHIWTNCTSIFFSSLFIGIKKHFDTNHRYWYRILVFSCSLSYVHTKLIANIFVKLCVFFVCKKAEIKYKYW